MSNPFLAEIRMFPFNFAPTGWAFCNGQLLPISQNTALFSLLGTNFGGDGKATFGLPNIQGNCVVDVGQGPGLSSYFVGESGGSQTVSLTTQEIPSHSHDFNDKPGVDGTTNAPAGNVFGKTVFNNQGTNGVIFTYTPTAPNKNTLNPQTISIAGSSLPHNNMMPYLTLNFCIAMQGVFPPRT
jgi:microcystin-dependent protein